MSGTLPNGFRRRVGVCEDGPVTIVKRTCHLCEATCGLELHLDDDARITLVRGNRDDVFSHGFLCPKGAALKDLDADPDRIDAPQVRDRTTGEWRTVSWDEAFALIAERLLPILEAHGRDALGVYMGNPCAHNLAPMIYNRVLNQAARTSNVFSASTVDQMPKQVAAAMMFGTGLSVPIPDIDHTDYLLILGANPYASNGSLMTAPDFPGRIQAVRSRGGKVVVVDPRRSQTAAKCDEWLPIVPGTDTHFLLGVANVLFADGLADVGEHVGGWVAGLDEVRAIAAHFTPEVVAPICGIDAPTIRRIAHELADAPTAAVYGRIGTCTQEFGTLASWAVDIVNTLTGNLDSRGGVLFNRPASGGGNTSGTPGKGREYRMGRRTTSVRGLPEIFGEYPCIAIADEILEAGDRRIRAFITVAGNPVLSNPDSMRLDEAFAALDFMIAVDCYRNETTRHADVILPPEPILARSHYDVALRSFAVRNVATYSPPVVDVEPGRMREWETLVRLAGILQGLGHGAEVVDIVDEFVLGSQLDKAAARLDTTPEALRAAVSAGGRRGPERMLDLMLRTGPYALTLDDLIAAPDGLDMGPLEPRVPEVLRTHTGMIELAPPLITADVHARLLPSLTRPPAPLLLVGRRDLRSNNSWMHNVRVLVKGKPRCTLHVHPDDAATLGLADGATARVASATGAVTIPVEVTDGIRPGVVSIPHGWGHDLDGIDMAIARANPGVNSNVLSSGIDHDPLSGNAILSGIPVEVVPA